MGSKKQSDQKRRQAELARRRKNRLHSPEGWQPRPPAEAELLDLAPIASPDEPAEDRALFDPAARHALSADLHAELALVLEAFDLCARGEPHAALDRLTAIARKSPYADWRLFIRGLVPFQRGDRAAAQGRNFALHVTSASPELGVPVWANSTCKWLERSDLAPIDLSEWCVLTIVELNQRASALIRVERAQQGAERRGAREDEFQ